jgi:hypothetical protein
MRNAIRSLFEPFILFLATDDLASTLRYFTTAFSTLLFPVVLVRRQLRGKFQQTVWMIGNYTAQLVPDVFDFGLTLDSLPLRKKDLEVSHKFRILSC